jgi:hypothetical protein
MRQTNFLLPMSFKFVLAQIRGNNHWSTGQVQLKISKLSHPVFYQKYCRLENLRALEASITQPAN